MRLCSSPAVLQLLSCSLSQALEHTRSSTKLDALWLASPGVRRLMLEGISTIMGVVVSEDMKIASQKKPKDLTRFWLKLHLKRSLRASLKARSS
jgi:hypothetical protein